VFTVCVQSLTDTQAFFIQSQKSELMGAVKTGLYDQTQEELALLTKALGHPARIAIVQELAKNTACHCGELVLSVGLAQSTISQHLKELRNAGIIRGTVNGDKPCYCLDRERIGHVIDALQKMLHSNLMDVQSCC
jgi:ArsR family transcriptional regulator, arsenate/arsenite/antimonite-responsive transcriptional repressor